MTLGVSHPKFRGGHTLNEHALKMVDRRTRNRSLSSLLQTPSYPGYISYLGCINRTTTSGNVQFLSYGDPNYMYTSNDDSKFVVNPILDKKSCNSFPRSCISPTPPLCSPEDDSEFAIGDDWKSPNVKKKTSQNTSSSSGYGSTDSDQEENLSNSQISDNIVMNERKSRNIIKEKQEDFTLNQIRRRSVPASLSHGIPQDVINIIQKDGHVRIETNVDTGEQNIMEIGNSLRRPETVMQLARRFGEIAAAQQNDLHKSRTSLYDGKENGCMSSSSSSASSNQFLNHSSSEARRGGIASLKVVGTVAMTARPNMFKQMDKVGSSSSPVTPRPMNPNSIKDALLRWVQSRVKDYPVNVTNFSSSWADGTAFCALIHRFAPNDFDFKQIDPKNRKENFELAFKIAEDNGICPLLEVEDMIMMGDRPDWKCVFTYVQTFYKHFKDRD